MRIDADGGGDQALGLMHGDPGLCQALTPPSGPLALCRTHRGTPKAAEQPCDGWMFFLLRLTDPSRDSARD